MEPALLLQVAGGVALLTGTAVLTHFFYVALHAPEKMKSLNQRSPISWGLRAYLSLLILSWMAFAFIGVYGLSEWLLGKAAVEFAILVAVLSLGLLNHLEQSAHITHSYRRSRKILQELERLIKDKIIPCERMIDDFQNKSNSAITVAEREAYAELACTASDLTKLCEYAVSLAQRKATERVEKQEQADKIAKALAKAQTAKQALRIKLQEVLNAAAIPLPVSKTIDFSMACNDVLIESTVAKQKWQVLYEFGGKLRYCLGEDAPIPTLLNAVPGIKPIAETTFMMEFEGNERDNYYEALCLRGKERGQLADGLTFESSLDGLVAAFFLRAALPGRLAKGHGLYNRNQEFIFTQEQTVAILINEGIPPDSEGLQAIKAPAGLRYSCAEDGTPTLRCLTYLPGKGFYDSSVSIVGGHASPVFETILYKWGEGIHY